MSLFTDTFAKLILEYLNVDSELESRLLIPAPTERIGKSLQAKLCDLLPDNIPSFLIVDHEVDEEKKWIVAEAITSKRIGKLVIIVQPGNVSRIPESVRGAITNSFNDEWPWNIDGELSAFSFQSHFILCL